MKENHLGYPHKFERKNIMKTVSFYSYKGGVGRSMALSYMSLFLAERGFNVCILDVDLEAPGIIHKFIDEPTHHKPGVLDYVHCAIDDNSQTPESIVEYFYDIPYADSESGYIKLMSAGQKLDETYWQKLSEINWEELFNDELKIGIGIFEYLKDQIKEQLSPDYLFIDSRSGVTVLSQACNAAISDITIILMANNRENFYGAKLMYNYIKSVKSKEIEVFCVLTRVPIPKADSPKETGLVDKLLKGIGDPNLESVDINIIHADRRAEFDEYAVLKIDGERNGFIDEDYYRLISKIVPPEMYAEKKDLTLHDEVPRAVRVLIVNELLHIEGESWELSSMICDDGKTDKWFDVNLSNLSSTGLLFLSRTPYEINDELYFRLTIAPKKNSYAMSYGIIRMNIKVAVKRCESVHFEHEIGVEFVDLSRADKVKLNEFINGTIFKHFTEAPEFWR